ncbi:hypothetical protein K435DRAFT_814428 [Dendrothele bispora CBS 962.96]|uniref:Uncharacterized protein n=1 Tax=Dendrothele bispora (strain CBS 962.96) TaxID=1314807 RepID=A0A4S8KIS0_DENBC|nr:hypothetical protein K435DRAFT_814428 [Dendrothele bispora CBS 962.96]
MQYNWFNGAVPGIPPIPMPMPMAAPMAAPLPLPNLNNIFGLLGGGGGMPGALPGAGPAFNPLPPIRTVPPMPIPGLAAIAPPPLLPPAVPATRKTVPARRSSRKRVQTTKIGNTTETGSRRWYWWDVVWSESESEWEGKGKRKSWTLIRDKDDVIPNDYDFIVGLGGKSVVGESGELSIRKGSFSMARVLPSGPLSVMVWQWKKGRVLVSRTKTVERAGTFGESAPGAHSRRR